LWRLRDDRGWWRYAWTDGSSPVEKSYLSITRDETCRTGFALDREAGAPISCRAQPVEGGVRLEVNAYLPRAEYRFLATVGTRLPVDGLPVVFLVPPAAREKVQVLLTERLGLVW
jgi:hypothetical protein